ncbi:MAG: aconitase X swivel domain-containing protein [Alphaproteobacteria bacterium]
MTIRTTILNPGRCRAPALVLDEPLSFWGGFDPARGVIVDRHHPQRGACLAGKVLVMPGSRGSAGTPAAIAEAIRRGVGPVAILLGTKDVNIAIGAMVAGRLYGGAVPVLAVAAEDYPRLRTGDEITIAVDGTVTIGFGAR